jgi:hypothetical protein
VIGERREEDNMERARGRRGIGEERNGMGKMEWDGRGRKGKIT